MVTVTDYASLTPTTDWGPSIQAAVDSLCNDPSGPGGIVRFPKGYYPTSTPIILRCPGITFQGEGGPSTKVSYLHWLGDNSAMFTLEDQADDFTANDLMIRGKKAGSAFRFANASAYRYGFFFDRCNISYFAKAFETIRPSKTWGGLLVSRSRLCYNGQVLNASEVIMNEWEFSRCRIEKNGLPSEGWDPQYAFNLRGSTNGNFYKCILEQQPCVLYADCCFGVELENCRFEGNTLDFGGVEVPTPSPVCYFEDCRRVKVNAFNRQLSDEDRPHGPNLIECINCRKPEVNVNAGGVYIWDEWDGVF